MFKEGYMNIFNEISKVKKKFKKEKAYYTDRLILKVLKANEAQKVLDYYLKNKEFLKEWEPKRPAEFYSYDYQYQLLDHEYRDYLEKEILKLWIFKKDEPDKIIGSISFNNIIYGNFLSCFLGYKLDKDEINKGFITEAIRKGIKVIFEDYKLHRIEANIIPGNLRSIRVVEKIGFIKEGYSKRYLKINGEWKDHIHYALYNENN